MMQAELNVEEIVRDRSLKVLCISKIQFRCSVVKGGGGEQFLVITMLNA